MAAVIEADTKVGHDVWMAYLIDDFDFLDEVCDALPLSAFTAKPLDCNFCTHPLSLEDFSIASSAQKVCLVVEFEFVPLNVEVETISIECFYKKAILLRVDFIF